jgi:DNA-binding transcriptional LysR family regulator
MLIIHFCMHPDTPWELFRTFEVVVRHGSLTAAARALGVSQSTVSRHLARLEESAGSPLLLRQAPVQLTDRGANVLAALEPMVDAALAARSALESTVELRGQVTLTTVGELVRWVLDPELATFYRAHSQLRLRILASNQRSSLAAGEADIALRMARPERGELVAKKLATETFGLFASAALSLHPAVPWLGLAGSLSHLEEQRWAERAFASRPPRHLVEDIESLGVAVQSGVGVALLPRQLAARLADVVAVRAAAVGAKDVGPVPTRELWMVVHRSKQRVPKVRAVMEWVERIFTDARRAAVAASTSSARRPRSA